MVSSSGSRTKTTSSNFFSELVFVMFFHSANHDTERRPLVLFEKVIYENVGVNFSVRTLTDPDLSEV